MPMPGSARRRPPTSPASALRPRHRRRVLRWPTCCAYLDTEASKLRRIRYITPANLDALFSEEFAEPTENPIGSGVFASQLRFVRDLPDTEAWDRVRAATAVRLSVCSTTR